MTPTKAPKTKRAEKPAFWKMYFSMSFMFWQLGFNQLFGTAFNLGIARGYRILNIITQNWLKIDQEKALTKPQKQEKPTLSNPPLDT